MVTLIPDRRNRRSIDNVISAVPATTLVDIDRSSLNSAVGGSSGASSGRRCRMADRPGRALGRRKSIQPRVATTSRQYQRRPATRCATLQCADGRPRRRRAATAETDLLRDRHDPERPSAARRWISHSASRAPRDFGRRSVTIGRLDRGRANQRLDRLDERAIPLVC